MFAYNRYRKRDQFANATNNDSLLIEDLQMITLNK